MQIVQKKPTQNQSLFQTPKTLKKSLSLKNNIIIFPNESATQPNLSSSPHIYKKNVSPSKQAIQCLKMKKQRLRYIENHNKTNLQKQNLIYSNFIYNPQSPKKLSNSRKSFGSVHIKKRTQSNEDDVNSRLKSARLSSPQNVRQMIKSQRYSRKNQSPNHKNSRIQQSKKLTKNLQILTQSKQLLQCQSMRKSTQHQFLHLKMASIIKDKNCPIAIQNISEVENEQRSFNKILKRLQQRNQTQNNYFQRQNSNIFKNDSKSQFLTESLLLKKKSNTLVNRKQLFQMALQWSNNKMQIMRPSITRINDRKNMTPNKTNQKNKLRKKQQEVIEGWIK